MLPPSLPIFINYNTLFKQLLRWEIALQCRFVAKIGGHLNTIFGMKKKMAAQREHFTTTWLTKAKSMQKAASSSSQLWKSPITLCLSVRISKCQAINLEIIQECALQRKTFSWTKLTNLSLVWRWCWQRNLFASTRILRERQAHKENFSKKSPKINGITRMRSLQWWSLRWVTS